MSFAEAQVLIDTHCPAGFHLEPDVRSWTI